MLTQGFKSLYAALLGTWIPAQWNLERLNVTPDRRLWITFLTIDERGSKIAKISVFDCHLSPVRRQMAIENSVSIDFYLRSSIALMFSIAAYPVWMYMTEGNAGVCHSYSKYSPQVIATQKLVTSQCQVDEKWKLNFDILPLDCISLISFSFRLSSTINYFPFDWFVQVNELYH